MTAHERETVDHFKARFHYWDEWSSARYVRRENPYLDPEAWKRDFPGTKQPEVVYGTVVRYLPIENRWVALEHDEFTNI